MCKLRIETENMEIRERKNPSFSQTINTKKHRVIIFLSS